MATAAKITGLVTRWWWVRHAPVPNPEGRCYGRQGAELVRVDFQEEFRRVTEAIGVSCID
jgi:hypothetical protein